MKVLVTGGAGFIGGYVCAELVNKGHTPVVMDRYRRDPPPQVEFFMGDVKSPADCTEAMAHIDAFIHLAAVLGTQETIQNPTPAAQTNIIGGLNILDGAAQYKIPGVYIGVGNFWMNNTYSITKTTIERFIQMYNNDRGTCINIVRAVNAYGPLQEPAHPYGPAKVRKITPSFCCRALKNDPIEIYGDGEQVSDMVYVRDVAVALVLAMEYAVKGERLKKPVEIGPMINNTVNEVALMIKRLANSSSEIVHLPMRPGEIPGSVVKANVDTIHQIGMSPLSLTELEWGMERTVKYFKAYLDAHS